MDKHAILCSSIPREQAKVQATPRLQRQGVDATFLDIGANATFSTEQAPTTVAH